MADWEELGVALATARRRAKLTQEEVAERLSIAQVSVSRHETGRGGQIPVETLERYAKLYQIPAGDLVRLVLPGGGKGQSDAPISYSNLPRHLIGLAAKFEIEALEMGADEATMKYVALALRSPEAVTLFRNGYEGHELSEEQQMKYLESHIAKLRALVKERVKQRRIK